MTLPITAVLPHAVWAMSAQSGMLPWDGPLEAIAEYLVGPAVHTLAWIAFGAAAVAYAIRGECSDGVSRLLRMGVGITVALNAVRIVNFLFG
jgi:type IV secretory pathway VirB2 component (pilin)